MVLDFNHWEEFRVGDLFSKYNGRKFSSIPESIGDIPLITSTSLNNGISKYVDEDSIPGNCITVSTNGACFDCFYHSYPIAVSSDVEVLYNKHLNKNIALFVCTILNQEKYRWNYGRKPKNNKVLNSIIKLPVDEDNVPDWQRMDKYVGSLKSNPVKTKNLNSSSHPLNTNSWKEFIWKDIFKIVKGKRLTKADMVAGKINFLGAISVNNGVRQHVEVDEYMPGNCISINYNGSVGEAFYQSEPFWASDDVNALYAKGWNMNQYRGLFLASVIKIERYKYSYGRKWKLENMKESIIKLPVTNIGTPDWEFMENYIKSLPNGDLV